jgi:hypothetical protein
VPVGQVLQLLLQLGLGWPVRDRRRPRLLHSLLHPFLLQQHKVVPEETLSRSMSVVCLIVVVGVVDVLTVVLQSCSYILSAEEACGN